MSAGTHVVWQGAPARGPEIRTWAAVLLILIGIFALLYRYMVTTGSCVPYLLEEDCIRRRRAGRIAFVFLVLAVMAAAALAVIIRTFLGYPLKGYAITASEIRSVTGWPLSGIKVQPIAHVCIKRVDDGLTFTGVGEKPIHFRHLPKGEADRLISLIQDLKAAPCTEPRTRHDEP